jgi:hypothetical protein
MIAVSDHCDGCRCAPDWVTDIEWAEGATMPRVAGKPFRCDACGVNVFQKSVDGHYFKCSTGCTIFTDLPEE